MNKEELETKNCKEIFSIIDKHQVLALMFHNDMIDYFQFLGMEGFQRLHEYQYYDESIGRRNLHKHYMNIYNELIMPINEIRKEEIIPSNFYKVNSLEVKSNFDKYVKKGFEGYLDWETKTKELYGNALLVFWERNDLESYFIIKEYLDDVIVELTEIYSIIKRLNMVNYDVTYISEMQDDFVKLYNKKMKTLRG